MSIGIRVIAKNQKGEAAMRKELPDSKLSSRKERFLFNRMFTKTITKESPFTIEVLLTRNWIRLFTNVLGPEALQKPIMNALETNGADKYDIMFELINE